MDGIVLDQYQPYVELIPMHLRMPFVHVPNALHVDYTGRTHEVYASMGTLQNGLIDIFRSITQAAVGLKELQFVLAVGGQLDPKQLGHVPANVMVVSYAPQIEILKRSSLCITHAGLNTVLESVSSGVPMVALPITND